jgi:hypothetical protein
LKKNHLSEEEKPCTAGDLRLLPRITPATDAARISAGMFAAQNERYDMVNRRVQGVVIVQVWSGFFVANLASKPIPHEDVMIAKFLITLYGF